MNGTLFFTATDGTGAGDHGEELWRSDGTTAGTALVKDIYPGTGNSSNPSELTNAGGFLFFAADDGTTGNELWRSDGTTAGTTLVKDIRSGSSGSYPSNVVNVGGAVFFRANDGSTGYELWRSDGTGAGTTLVKDIDPGPGESDPENLTNVGGTLFFAADDGTHGYELWTSDGTGAGTLMVKDIHPGGSGSVGSNGKYGGSVTYTNVGGTLFFAANDGSTGIELWRADQVDSTSSSVSCSPSSLKVGSPSHVYCDGDRHGTASTWRTVRSGELQLEPVLVGVWKYEQLHARSCHQRGQFVVRGHIRADVCQRVHANRELPRRYESCRELRGGHHDHWQGRDHRQRCFA